MRPVTFSGVQGARHNQQAAASRPRQVRARRCDHKSRWGRSVRFAAKITAAGLLFAVVDRRCSSAFGSQLLGFAFADLLGIILAAGFVAIGGGQRRRI